MKLLFRTYRLLNILSLDVAVGAVIGAMFFAKIFKVSVLPYGLTCLGLTVWIIYTADHLLDARNAVQAAASERHRFHQIYFKPLLITMIAALAVDTVLLFFIRKVVFMEGLGLAAVIFVYFSIQRYLKFLKEVVGGILYSGGVLLIPWSVNTNGVTTPQGILIVQFTLTALINLLLFSLFDKKQDEQDRQSSFATVMGERATTNALLFLFFVQAILTIELSLYKETPVFILVLMNGLLLFIFLGRKHFEINDRYRLLGDAVFLLPIIYIWT